MPAAGHPPHTHLVTFQVVGRTPFDVEAYEEAYEGPHGTRRIRSDVVCHRPDGATRPAERGFKDTVKVFTTIRAKFDLPADEDNDMMRPFEIVP